MEFIRPDLQAICYGIAMSVGSPLLAEGAQGSGWRYRTAGSSSTSLRRVRRRSSEFENRGPEVLALRLA